MPKKVEIERIWWHGWAHKKNEMAYFWNARFSMCGAVKFDAEKVFSSLFIFSMYLRGKQKKYSFIGN